VRTPGTRRWVRVLQPFVERGYTRGHVEHGQLILEQDVTGHMISLPMPSSVVGRWYASDDLMDVDDDEDRDDVVVAEALMSRSSTR
jgi:hypothetical protein